MIWVILFIGAVVNFVYVENVFLSPASPSAVIKMEQKTSHTIKLNFTRLSLVEISSQNQETVVCDTEIRFKSEDNTREILTFDKYLVNVNRDVISNDFVPLSHDFEISLVLGPVNCAKLIHVYPLHGLDVSNNKINLQTSKGVKNFFIYRYEKPTRSGYVKSLKVSISGIMASSSETMAVGFFTNDNKGHITSINDDWIQVQKFDSEQSAYSFTTTHRLDDVSGFILFSLSFVGKVRSFSFSGREVEYKKVEHTSTASFYETIIGVFTLTCLIVGFLACCVSCVLVLSAKCYFDKVVVPKRREQQFMYKEIAVIDTSDDDDNERIFVDEDMYDKDDVKGRENNNNTTKRQIVVTI